MKKNLFKIMGLLVALTMLVSLAACGNGNSSSSATPSPSATVSGDDGAGEEVTLNLWHMWVSDGDGNKKPFETVLSKAKEQLPGINIVVDGTDNESYKTKIKTAVAANEAPDIFFTWAAGFSKPFVSSGKVLALDEYMDDIKDKLLPGIEKNLTYDGKVYGLPFQMQVAPLYCNTEIFEQNGVKIPETYDELLAAVQTFGAKGITPMVCGAKDKWPAMFYFDALALRTAGAKANIDALNKVASFNTPEFVDAAKKLDELTKAGAFGKGALGLSWDEANIAFSQGQAAMIFNGNWVAGTCEGEGSLVKGKVAVVPFPLINGGKSNKTEFLGGSGDGFMVSANTKNKDAAVKALKFICENMSTEAYLAGAGLPGWKANVDESKISPLVKSIVDMTKDATEWVLWWDVFLEGDDADVHKNLVVDVIAGQKTPEEFAQEMQKLNEK